MSSGIITVGRKHYASGLYWENSPSGRLSQEAKEAARQPGNPAAYYVTRPGNKQGRVPQFGLAPPTEGFHSGMPTLAGSLANQQPGSWIGAFPCASGVGLVIVRDDLIVPDGDIFFEDEGEARDRLFQEIAVGGFQRIYAPETWAVPGADTMPLGLLLNERADVRLRPVSLSAKAKLILLVGIGLVVVVLGAGWYIQKQRAAEELENMRRLEALNRLRAKTQKLVLNTDAPQYPDPIRYWEKHPTVLAVVNACQDAMKKVPVGMAGWHLTEVRCDEKTLSAKWSRTSGFSELPEGTVTNVDARQASLVIPFPPLEVRSPEALWSQKDITDRYLRQNWTGGLKRMPEDPRPPPPAGYKGKWDPPAAPWVKRSFTLTVPVLPWTLSPFFKDVPGIFVTQMKFNGGESVTMNSWTVEGVIYENRN